MIDLHLHLLPEVDDGAADFDEAVEMCRLAADDGCEVVCATPHQRQDRWPNRDLGVLRALHAELQRRAGPAPRIVLGAEIHVDTDFLDDLAAPERNGLMPLADGRYLLLEFGHRGLVDGPATIVHEVVQAGYVPILAHPELIPAFAGDLEAVDRLVDRGALVQLTAASVTGDYGRTARTSAHRFLAADLCHFVASDGHGTRWRPPGLSAAHAELCRRWGPDTADRLTRDNPRAVVDNQEIAP